MNKIYLDKNIYCIENVLSKKDLKTVQDFSKDEQGWRGHKIAEAIELGTSSNSLKSMSPEIYGIFMNMFVKIIKPAEPLLNISPVAELQRFIAGEKDFSVLDKEWSMTPHQDNNSSYSMTANIEKGLIFYINDDFEGGEIEYVNKNIIHRPVANSIIVHPANQEYTHGVRLVTSGHRCIMTNFYRK